MLGWNWELHALPGGLLQDRQSIRFTPCTNNNGKWGIQLSSVIFTPAEYIGQTYNDAIEGNLRSMRTSMTALSRP